MQTPGFAEITATVCLVLALLQTFLAKRLWHWAGFFKKGSAWNDFLHWTGEVEVAFGFWAGFYLFLLTMVRGGGVLLRTLDGLRFTEPAFVFAVMLVCSTRPILTLAEKGILFLADRLPFKKPMAFYLAALVAGPLMGSLITEPAAMTVTALLLLRYLYDREASEGLLYATLGLLFVNISIGGTLTPFAAPPILMVAGKWDWDLTFMLVHFGWKGILACLLSSGAVAYWYRKEIRKLKLPEGGREGKDIPLWVTTLHLVFLVLIVAASHHVGIFLVLLLTFLALYKITEEHQAGLLLKNASLVTLFLAGLVILGSPQKWWLEGILTSLDSLVLYFGSMCLTAFTDNAALTYLGSRVSGLSEASKYFLVAGSVVGGGLTVVANAPNPVGYGILKASFGKEGISPLRLFLSALLPTLIAALCFCFF